MVLFLPAAAALTLAVGLTCPLVLLGAAAVAALGFGTAQHDTEAMEETWARHPTEPATA